MEKIKMYLQIDNGGSGLLIYDGNGRWYYFYETEIPYNIIYPKNAIAADNEAEKIDSMIESIRNAIDSGDLYSAEEFIDEYSGDERYYIPEYDALSIEEIDNIENYETTYCGDRLPKNHDITKWYKI